jgi:hypothetical protein
MSSPFDVFDPSTALDPTQYVGAAGAARLVEAGQHFPGGSVGLVLALFFTPIGPGIPAGVLLARHIALAPAATFGLYALSDVLAAVVCHPVFSLMRRHGRRAKPIRWLGRRILSFAMLGVRTPERAGMGPALSRIATVGFGADIYTAGMLATGLPVPPLPGWVSAIVGDLLWFTILLGTSVLAAGISDDDRFIGLVMIVAMIVLPRVARRFVPALR